MNIRYRPAKSGSFLCLLRSLIKLVPGSLVFISSRTRYACFKKIIVCLWGIFVYIPQESYPLSLYFLKNLCYNGKCGIMNCRKGRG